MIYKVEVAAPSCHRHSMTAEASLKDLYHYPKRPLWRETFVGKNKEQHKEYNYVGIALVCW